MKTKIIFDEKTRDFDVKDVLIPFTQKYVQNYVVNTFY